jgi:hypothetical protein
VHHPASERRAISDDQRDAALFVEYRLRRIAWSRIVTGQQAAADVLDDELVHDLAHVRWQPFPQQASGQSCCLPVPSEV